MYLFRHAAIALAIVFGSLASASADVCQWTGGGPNNRWSTLQNWTNCHGGGWPLNGDAVVFRAGAGWATNFNDLPNLTLAGIQIDGTALGTVGYEIFGDPITLTGPLTMNAPIGTGLGARIRTKLIVARQIVFANIHANADALSVDTVELAAELTVNAIKPIGIGTLTGTGGLKKIGAAQLFLFGRGSTYTGRTNVQEGGVIAVDGTALGASGDQHDTNVSPGAYVRFMQTATTAETFRISGNGPNGTGALRVTDPGVTATLTGPVILTTTASVAPEEGGTLILNGPVTSVQPNTVFQKNGAGTVVFGGSGNTWGDLIVQTGVVALGAANVLPDTARVLLVRGALDLRGQADTIGTLGGGSDGRVLLSGGTLTINQVGEHIYEGSIEGAGHIVKTGPEALILEGFRGNTYTGTFTVQAGTLVLHKNPGRWPILGALIVNGGLVKSNNSDQIPDEAAVTINSPGRWELRDHDAIGSLAGSGTIAFLSKGPGVSGGLTIGAAPTSTTFSGTISGPSSAPLIKRGTGTLTLTGQSTFTPSTRIENGTLQVNGSVNPDTPLQIESSGVLTGKGRVGYITGSGGAAAGAIALPVDGPLAAAGAIVSGQISVALTATTSSQLRLVNGLMLRPGAKLNVALNGTPAKGAAFTIVTSGEAVSGTFDGLPQGATITVDGQRFTINYAGGASGRDVVLTALDGPKALTYFLAEGSTGAFFDEDVLLANPHPREAPVTITFLKDNGQQVVVTRTLGPQSHAVIHVDEVPGLEGAAVSATVESTSGQELFVERTMFWGPERYAGHTGSALLQPSQDWFFAEGAQGFFDTFVLLINPHAAPTDVTLTFLREVGAPVVKTVTVAASSRRTVGAYEYPELASRAFGISVRAARPIMAERSMYFASTPGRLWGGGHVSAGVTAPSATWFLAEGATGGFFDTFILLSNPQSTAAEVTVKYLLWTGAAIAVQKTIPPGGRLTINPETEADARLKNAAFSTDVTSNVPIIVERSMYWPGATQPWGEAHNSVAFVRPELSWGLAEGRLGGGETPFSTFILLANPRETPSEVTATFLRETGAPIVKTYTVPATGRFTIDTSTIPELHDTTFGVSIAVTNGIPIVVERSMYWDANGIFWSGGTNAPGIPWNIP